MKRRLFLLLCLLFFSAEIVLGQGISKTIVSGMVVETATKEPMEFVNVVLFKASDKTQMNGATTSRGGQFQFTGLPAGHYFLQISFLGFETKNTAVFSIDRPGQELDLGEIDIEMSANILEQVEVVAEKSTYSFTLDRKVYNVEKDIMSQSSSATEILQNLPSVTADVNGQLSLRGTSNITFFINGRPSALLRANPTAALQQMPANTIERIEIITNPSAKYKPDGTGGIINIVLKKEKRQGWNGTLLGNIGNLERYNGNLTLNYGVKDFNAFASYGIRHSNTPRSLLDFRISKDGAGGILSTFNNTSTTQKDAFSHIVNGGLDFRLGDRSQVEIAGEYYFGIDDVQSISDWLVTDEFTSAFSIDRVLDEREGEYEVSVNFEHEFEKDDHTLTLDFLYANYEETEDNFLDERHSTPSIFQSLTHNLIRKGGPLTGLAIEYANPLGEDTELEAGYVGEFLKDNIRLLGEDFDDQENRWVTDFNKTNTFNFTQNIHALYTTLGHTIEDFSFLLGLRAEQALITSKLITTNTEIPNDYFKLFPTLHLSYEMGGGQELQLSYSRRVNRADSDEHNPFSEYDDPRNRETGNPKLKPENIHSLELGYQLQTDYFSFIPSLYYRYKYDAFTEIEEIVQDSILQRTYVNLASEQSAGLELIFTGRIKELVSLNFSANAFYNEIDASNLGLSSNRSLLTWNAKLALNANISASSFAQINASYRSARLTTQGKFRPLYLLNAGFRQEVLKSKASVIVTISDVFNSLKWESLIDTKDLYRKRNYKRNSQIITVGFVYRFGQSFSKKQEQLDFEDKI